MYELRIMMIEEDAINKSPCTVKDSYENYKNIEDIIDQYEAAIYFINETTDNIDATITLKRDGVELFRFDSNSRETYIEHCGNHRDFYVFVPEEILEYLDDIIYTIEKRGSTSYHRNNSGNNSSNNSTTEKFYFRKTQ